MTFAAPFFALSLAASPLSEIPDPVVTPIENASQPVAQCLTREFRRQAPENLLAPGEILISGPSIRQDVAPRGSVAEYVFVGRKSPRWPEHGTYLTLSFWMETPDASLWRQTYEDGRYVYRASSFLNPGKVFNRVSFQHVFDLDVSACQDLLR